MCFWLLLAGSFWAAGCSRKSEPEVAPPAEHRELAGQSYLSLQSTLGNIPVSAETEAGTFYQLVADGHQLRWQANSRRMWFNGIMVWLELSPLLADGVLYLTERDISHTLKPLLALTNTASSLDALQNQRPRILIDPGHGGRDPGAVNEPFGLKEKELTLKTSLKLARTLRLLGWDVELTRADDRFVALPQRAAEATELNADLFLSIHYNAAVNPQAEGIEVFVLMPPTALEADAETWLPGHHRLAESLRMAWQLQSALIRQTGAVDRGLRRERFAVLRDLTVPGVLVELGFLSHAETARQLSEDQAIDALVEALVIGLEKAAADFFVTNPLQ